MLPQFRILFITCGERHEMDIAGADMIIALTKFHHKYVYNQPSNSVIVISITAL